MKAYGPTMQSSSKTLDYINCSKCAPLSMTHAIGTNHHRSIAWSI